MIATDLEPSIIGCQISARGMRYAINTDPDVFSASVVYPAAAWLRAFFHDAGTFVKSPSKKGPRGKYYICLRHLILVEEVLLNMLTQSAQTGCSCAEQAAPLFKPDTVGAMTHWPEIPCPRFPHDSIACMTLICAYSSCFPSFVGPLLTLNPHRGSQWLHWGRL